MILHQLYLRDFRQFRGEQTLEFARSAERNVTVVHGYNGSGKTTLLNAFVWVLYGDTTPDFESPHRLLNEGALADAEVGDELEVVVRLQFEVNGADYIAERRTRYKKTAVAQAQRTSEALLEVRERTELGELVKVGSPQDRLESFIPPRLYPFFFFNGERIGDLAKPEAYEEVAEGAKVLLDLEVFDRAVRHLSNIAKEYRDEAAQHSGREGQALQEERSGYEAEAERYEEDLELRRQKEKAWEVEIESISETLTRIPKLAQWQQERSDLEKEQQETSDRIASIKRELKRLIYRSGYLVFSAPLLRRVEDLLSEAHQTGELPSPMKRQFVDELLRSGTCICRRPLDPDSDPRAALEAWRNKAVREEVERGASVLRAHLVTLSRERAEFLERIDELQEERVKRHDRRRAIGERLSEISRLISGEGAEEDGEKLEQRRRELDRWRRENAVDMAKLSDELGTLQQKIADVDRRIRTSKKADVEGQLAQRRFVAIENVASVLKEVRDVRYDEMRQRLSSLVHKLWYQVSIKDYEALLDEEFRLRLVKRVQGERQTVVGASTGEKQVLALAFIGALVRLAADVFIHESGAGEDLSSNEVGEYPIVIDSAFGQLEPEYIRGVARWLPSLAKQIIVMVSRTQWRTEVREELGRHVGASWILECKTPKHETKQIELRGRSFPYVVYRPDEAERTDIVEVA